MYGRLWWQVKEEENYFLEVRFCGDSVSAKSIMHMIFIFTILTNTLFYKEKSVDMLVVWY